MSERRLNGNGPDPLTMLEHAAITVVRATDLHVLWLIFMSKICMNLLPEPLCQT
jgi:hypothetical protein